MQDRVPLHLSTAFDRDDGSAVMLLKRRLYTVYLGVVMLGSLLLLAFPPGGREGVGGTVTLVVVPISLVFAATCIAALWRFPAGPAIVEQALYWSLYPVFLGILVVTLRGAEDAAAQQTALHSFSTWLPIAAVWAFLAFGSRRGLIASFGFLATSAIVFGAFVPAGAELGPLLVAFGAQLGLVGTLFIVILYGFAVLLERQSAARASAEVVADFASRDVLTGLPNRLALETRFEQAQALALRDGRVLAVCFVDLDDFKRVNDTFGHAAGDDLLRQFARRLEGAVRASDTVARIGGDEFVVLAMLHDHDQVDVLMDKLVGVQRAPFDLDGRSVALGCSVGVGLYPRDGADGAGLLARADRAMYDAKIARKGRRAALVGTMAGGAEDASAT